MEQVIREEIMGTHTQNLDSQSGYPTPPGHKRVKCVRWRILMSGGHTIERLGIRFRCCTRCVSVSRVDQCLRDRLSATFGEASDVLTRELDSTWIPVAEEMSVTVMSAKTVESTLPVDGFGVPDIYVEHGQKEEEADRLFVDSDGDYGEETCED